MIQHRPTDPVPVTDWIVGTAIVAAMAVTLALAWNQGLAVVLGRVLEWVSH